MATSSYICPEIIDFLQEKNKEIFLGFLQIIADLVQIFQ